MAGFFTTFLLICTATVAAISPGVADVAGILATGSGLDPGQCRGMQHCGVGAALSLLTLNVLITLRQ